MHTLSNVEISQCHAVINGRSLNSSSACHSHTTEMDTIRLKKKREPSIPFVRGRRCVLQRGVR